MIFGRKKPATPTPNPDLSRRLKLLVRDARDRPASGSGPAEAVGSDLDVMALLVELRAAARRGSESSSAVRLGPEFNRYLGEFYNLAAELQPIVIEALLTSQRLEQESDLAGAVAACEAALKNCPDYLPFLERLAGLERARGQIPTAERWFTRLLAELDQLELYPRGLEICRELIERGCTDSDLLEQVARRLEASGDLAGASRCYAARARGLLQADRPAEALGELDQALNLSPDDAALHLELAGIYERLEEVDRAAAAYDRAEALAVDDPETLVKVLLVRARVGRPEEAALGRLMDLLEPQPLARTRVLEQCAQAVLANPYSPHLLYVHGILLAQDGQETAAIESLRTAADRYAAQSDQASELEARLTLQQVDTRDEPNRRRVAALYFDRGDVHLAMQALAGLARVARRAPRA